MNDSDPFIIELRRIVLDMDNLKKAKLLDVIFTMADDATLHKLAAIFCK